MLLRRVHVAAAVIFVVAIVVQVFLAGAAIVNLGGSGDFGTHVEFGYTWLGIAAVALLVTALIARRPRRELGVVVAIVVLYVIQTALPGFRDSVPALAFLHPVNAMLLFTLAAWYAREAWRGAVG
jgi:hypothetical protein